MSKALERRLERLMRLNHDITEHLGLLRGLAMQCRTIVEFGFRTGESTTALMCSSACVTSYDIERCHIAPEFTSNKRFQFVRGDSRKADIPECDMLFIDSLHTGEQLAVEINRHHHKVRRWIVMHDTGTYGAVGQGGKQGLQLSIDLFLAGFPEWKVLLVLPNNNGITLLERVGETVKRPCPISRLS